MATPLEKVRSPRAIEEMKTQMLRVRLFATAQHMWDKMLSDGDQARLGGDLEAVWREYGTVGIWSRLKGVSYERAVIEIAYGVGHLDAGGRTWLLREFCDQHADSQRTVDAAISAGHLVLIETPRAAFWSCVPIEIDWDKEERTWSFLWMLCERSKHSLTLTQVDFGRQMSPSALSTAKCRLVNHPAFPQGLADHMKSKRGQGYYLDIPAAEIRLFLVEECEVATEWIGQKSPFAEMLETPSN